MPTISFDITAEESSAIYNHTKSSAQEYLERNARAHVRNCVEAEKSKEYAALGLPATIGQIGLKQDEIDYLKQKRIDEEAAKAAEAIGG